MLGSQFCIVVHVFHKLDFHFPNCAFIIANLCLDCCEPVFDQLNLNTARIVGFRHDTLVGRLVSKSAVARFIGSNIAVIRVAEVGEARGEGQR